MTVRCIRVEADDGTAVELQVFARSNDDKNVRISYQAPGMVPNEINLPLDAFFVLCDMIDMARE